MPGSICELIFPLKTKERFQPSVVVIQTFNPSRQISEFQARATWGAERGGKQQIKVTEDCKGQASLLITFTVGCCSGMCSDNPEKSGKGLAKSLSAFQ